MVSGLIEDEQGKFNLNNLVDPSSGQPRARDVTIFRQLLVQLDLDPGLADAVVDWVDANADLFGTAGAEDAYYLALPRPHRAANQAMLQPEELYRVKGFDAKIVARVRPHVTALPATARSKVNVNTATRPLLAALLAGAEGDAAQMIVERRTTRPFANRDDIVDAVKQPGLTGTIDGDMDVKSAFFQVRVQVAQDDVHLAADALVQRKKDAVSLVWRRPRF